MRILCSSRSQNSCIMFILMMSQFLPVGLAYSYRATTRQSTAPSCKLASVLPSVPSVLPSVAREEGISVENDGNDENDASI
jgi:hypothetical protein